VTASSVFDVNASRETRRREATREPVDARHLRHSVGQLVTGVTVVTVVTYDLDAAPRGVTVNSSTSVSVDPPPILVYIAGQSRAETGLSGAPLVVNVLAADQHAGARPAQLRASTRIYDPHLAYLGVPTHGLLPAKSHSRLVTTQRPPGPPKLSTRTADVVRAGPRHNHGRNYTNA
jgi:hypothetical protein